MPESEAATVVQADLFLLLCSEQGQTNFSAALPVGLKESSVFLRSGLLSASFLFWRLHGRSHTDSTYLLSGLGLTGQVETKI